METQNETVTSLMMIIEKGDGNGKRVFDQIVSNELLRVMSIIFHVSLCQVVSIFGATANIINMMVFVKIGFSETIYISLTSLAFTDFGTCFLLIWRTIALNPWFTELDLPFVPNDMTYLTSAWPHVIFTRLTTILTAFISFERCLCVILPLRVKTIITRKVVKTVVVCTILLGVVKAVLIYSTHWYGWKFYPDKNKTLIGLVFSKNRKETESVYNPILYIALPFICFIIVAVSAILLVFALRKNSKWKQSAVSARPTDSGTEKNQTVTSKEMKVAKMVTIISILYICCSFPHAVFTFIRLSDRSISITGANRNLLSLMGGMLFFLQAVNSSSNIFVYYNNSTAYRTTFKQIFGCAKSKQNEKPPNKS